MNIESQTKSLLAKLCLNERSILFGNGETIEERALKNYRKSVSSKDNVFINCITISKNGVKLYQKPSLL